MKHHYGFQDVLLKRKILFLQNQYLLICPITESFLKSSKKDFEIINADFYVRQKNYSLAKESLLNCINKYKLKKDKARLNYILAQIFQIEENFKQASKYYNQVLKSNSDYSMVFNTKMNLALCADKSSKNSEKMRKDLVKMTKDDKKH